LVDGFFHTAIHDLLCFVTEGINPMQLGNRRHYPNPKKAKEEKYEFLKNNK
jgi:hypothetical protein